MNHVLSKGLINIITKEDSSLHQMSDAGVYDVDVSESLSESVYSSGPSDFYYLDCPLP